MLTSNRALIDLASSFSELPLGFGADQHFEDYLLSLHTSGNL